MTTWSGNPVDELVDDAYLDASQSASAYVRALSAGILETLGLWRQGEAAPLSQWRTDFAVVPELETALAWLLAEARDLGAVRVEPSPQGVPLFRSVDFDVAEAIAHSTEQLRLWAPGVGSSLEMLSYVASRYPDFLQGTRSGGAILYKGPALELTTSYFSAANPLYDVHNQLGWRGVQEALARLGRPAHVLELGVGTGGGTAAVLRGLAASDPGALASFTITDISPSFLLPTAQRLHQENPLPTPLAHRRLDFSRSPLDQGFAAGSVDVLLAVNALHNASDPVAALAGLRPLLARDGFLVVSESLCTPGEHVHQDFVFNLLPQPESRFRDAAPTSRFFSVEVWRQILHDAGYGGAGIYANHQGPQLALLALGGS